MSQSIKYFSWPTTLTIALISCCFAIAGLMAGYEAVSEEIDLADHETMVEFVEDSWDYESDGVASEDDEVAESEEDFEATKIDEFDEVGQIRPSYSTATVSWLAKNGNFHYCMRAGLYPHNVPEP